jgi:hypothetical protein
MFGFSVLLIHVLHYRVFKVKVHAFIDFYFKLNSVLLRFVFHLETHVPFKKQMFYFWMNNI